MSFSRSRPSAGSAAPAYLALTCISLAATPALAQDQGGATRLGGVTVTDTAIDEQGQQGRPGGLAQIYRPAA